MLLLHSPVADDLSTPTNVFLSTDIDSSMWGSAADDDFQLLDGLLSSTATEMANLLPLLSSAGDDHRPSASHLVKQQHNHNNNSQVRSPADDKQAVGPLGANL